MTSVVGLLTLAVSGYVVLTVVAFSTCDAPFVLTVILAAVPSTALGIAVAMSATALVGVVVGLVTCAAAVTLFVSMMVLRCPLF